MQDNTKRIVDEFHELFYGSQIACYWRGIPILKNPNDLWMYQEIIYETKPDIIIETGTMHGGSALWFASVLDQIGKGKVITIDIRHYESWRWHPRVTYILGDSISNSVVSQVREQVAGNSVMVSLDSSHDKGHVLAETEII